MNLNQALRQQRVLVCAGPGGVGKTTISAALALHAAMQGRRVMCLTVDPAKRLADSLGFSNWDGRAQQVSQERFVSSGLECPGELHVMMLDAKQTFDELIIRNARSAEDARRILTNPVYRHLSSSLAGTQEYMAIEKLCELIDDSRFDLVVLDTPPTDNAVDLFGAPQKLIEGLDSPALKWLASPERHSRLTRILGKGGQLVIKSLAKVTGAEFLESISAFLQEMDALFGGFRSRAERIQEVLRSSDLSFVVVTRPTDSAIAEAITFARYVRESGFSFSCAVVNSVAGQLMREVVAPAAWRVPPPNWLSAETLGKMHDVVALYTQLAESERVLLDRLRHNLSAQSQIKEIPMFDADVYDLPMLHRVAHHVTAA